MSAEKDHIDALLNTHSNFKNQQWMRTYQMRFF